MNRMRWAGRGLAATGLALVGLAGCGEPDDTVEWDGLPTVVPTASASPSTGTGEGPDRFTPRTGECGVTLPCGLGAGPDGPVTP